MTVQETEGVPVTPAMRRVRVILIVIGVALLALGGIVLLQDVAPSNYLGILIWFAGALVLHDGILAPIIFGISLLARRAGTRIPFAVILIVQAAVVFGAIIALLVFPEIIKQSIGSANPSILPLDYGINLVFFYLALAVLTAAAIGVYFAIAARRRAKG